MTEQNDPPAKGEYISPEEMQQWLRQEIADSTKALELRIKEAIGFVTDYATGKIPPTEADEKHWRYQYRWGEALLGAHVGGGITDEEILKSIDKAQEQVQGKYSTPQESARRYKEAFDKPGRARGFDR